MRSFIHSILSIAAFIALQAAALMAQDQALYFDGSKRWAEFKTPANMPSGNESRTIEFWVKLDPHQEGIHDILQLGMTNPGGGPTNAGKAFGIAADVKDDGKAYLNFWGAEAANDWVDMASLPDDQWHFVALTYDNSNRKMRVYVDGEEHSSPGRTFASDLRTAAGDLCYIGGFLDGWHASRPHAYFKGAIDNLAIWREARTQAQIRDDMTLHYGDLDNLVIYFDFKEGHGSSFSSKSPKKLPPGSNGINASLFSDITGTLHGAGWTKPLNFASGAVYFENYKSEVVLDYPGYSGAESRTVSFWLKSKMGNVDGECEVLRFSDFFVSAESGGNVARHSFGKLVLEKSGNRNILRWKPTGTKWTGPRDFEFYAGDLSDNQWHYITIVYDVDDERTIKLYLDGRGVNKDGSAGVVKGMGSDIVWPRRMNFWLSNFNKPDQASFSLRSGAIDDLVIWGDVRTPNEILSDWSGRFDNPDKLLAFYDVLTDEPVRAARPSLEMPFNGVWYIIQNKSEVDTDLDLPARRFALKANDAPAKVTIERVPLTGEMDEFLWRAIKVGDVYELVNKKYGYQVLDNSLRMAGPARANRAWQISHSNLARHGTNAFTLANGSQNLSMDSADRTISLTAPATDDTKQAWLFQPMRLADGYHIPVSEDSIRSPYTATAGTGKISTSPFIKKLMLGNGISLFATNTVSDWAVLNSHLIISNMINAVTKVDFSATITNDWRKEVQIISQYDSNELTASYPIIKGIWTQEKIARYRGSQGYHPERELFITTITEEVMCRLGGGDPKYREFDQVVHEFGHAIDSGWNQRGSATPTQGYNSTPVECYAASVQAWFNNNFSYPTFVQDRVELAQSAPAQFNYLKRALNEENSWSPPRNFRRAPVFRPGNPPTVITRPEPTNIEGSATPLRKNVSILQSEYGNSYLKIGNDGNVISRGTITDGGQWLSYQNMGLKPYFTSATFNNGQLSFVYPNAADNVALGLSTSTPGAKLILSSENAHRSTIKIVDDDGKTLWRPDLVVQGGAGYGVIPSNSGSNFGNHNAHETKTMPYWVRNMGVDTLIVTMTLAEQTPTGSNAFSASPSITRRTLPPKAGTFFDIAFTPPAAVAYNTKVNIAFTVANPARTGAFSFPINGTGVVLPTYDLAEHGDAVWLTGESIWKYANNDWKTYGFGTLENYAKRIDLQNDGTPWIVNNADNLRKLIVNNSPTAPSVREDNATSAIKRDGVKDVAIHTPGSIWALSTTAVTSATSGSMSSLNTTADFKVLHYGVSASDPARSEWNENVSGGGVAIEIENDAPGTPWVVTSAGKVYRYIASDNTETDGVNEANTWQEIAMPASVTAVDIADGRLLEGQTYGEMFILGSDGFIYKASRSTTGYSIAKDVNNPSEGFAATGYRLARTGASSDVFWVVYAVGEVKKLQSSDAGFSWESIR